MGGGGRVVVGFCRVRFTSGRTQESANSLTNNRWLPTMGAFREAFMVLPTDDATAKPRHTRSRWSARYTGGYSLPELLELVL